MLKSFLNGGRKGDRQATMFQHWDFAGKYLDRSTADTTESTVDRLSARGDDPIRPDPQQLGRDNALLVRGTMRAGEVIQSGGSVVILGDVNPGAQVHAGGDVVVMGRLRGIAHAGAPDKTDAVVVAFRLHPTQLRIGTAIGRAPDAQDAELPGVPEMARVQGGAVIVEPFHPSLLNRG